MEEAILEPLSVSSFLTIHVVSFNKIWFFSDIIKYNNNTIKIKEFNAIMQN